ncbi:MAG: hypothetical protein R3B48_30670 [Kofleriaceae bacterium]
MSEPTSRARRVWDTATHDGLAQPAAGKTGGRTLTEASAPHSSDAARGGEATQRLARNVEAAEQQTRRLAAAISARRFLEARASAELLRTLQRGIRGALAQVKQQGSAGDLFEELDARWATLAPRVATLLEQAPQADPHHGLDLLGLGHAEDEARWGASFGASASSKLGAVAPDAAAASKAPPASATTSSTSASDVTAATHALVEATGAAPPQASVSAPSAMAIDAADADADAVQVDVARLSVRYRASWLLANPGPRALWGLQRLRGAGAISWASDDGLQRVVALTRWDQLPSARNTLTFVLTPTALSVIGLPPSQDAAAQLVGSGVEVALAMPMTGLRPGTRLPLSTAERTRLAEALTGLTGLPVLEEPEREIAIVGGAGVVVFLSSAQCEQRFGQAAWQTLQRRVHKRRAQDEDRTHEEEAHFTRNELPARLTQHSGLVISGDSVPFAVEVDWSVAELRLLSAAARDRFVKRKSGFDVRWTVTRVDGRAGRDKPRVYTSSGESEALKRSITLQLDKGERSGIFSVEAAIGSNHWRPRTVATKVEVKTEETRMVELRRDANGLGAGALAAEGLVARAHDFDIGFLDDKISKRGDDHGKRFEGQVDALFERRSLAERAQVREARLAHATAARAYLQRRAGDKDVDAAIEAFDAEIAKLRRAGEELEQAAAGGWQTFEIRGTYLSRTLGVESGTLDLYGEVKLLLFGNVMTTHVRLRDLSRRFEQESYVFSGAGRTFEDALEAAFVDFCVTEHAQRGAAGDPRAGWLMA